MAIRRVQSGQTFRNWIDITNDVVTEINDASSSGGPNKIVRYDSLGGLALSSFQANTLVLENGISVNAISTTFDPVDNNTIATTSAIYNYVESKKDVIYDTLSENTSIRVTSTDATIKIEDVDVIVGTKDLVTITANTEFDQNVLISGNLLVEGESVYISTTELTVEDKVVTFNKGDTFGADGSGFEIESSGSIISSITYDLANSAFDILANNQSVKIVPLLSDLTLNLDQDLSTTSNVEFFEIQANNKILVPTVTSTPLTGQAGQIHFNITDTTFEGFDGTAWGSLGGVSTPDKSTKIVANNISETLEFTANNSNVLNINENSSGFLLDVSVAGNTALSGALNVTGETILHDELLVNGDITSNSNIISLGTGSVVLPVGTDGERLTQQGAIRYNTDQSSFEGYDGSNWGSLGGVSTPDKSTKIVANNASETLEFTANNSNVLNINEDSAGFLLDVSVAGNTALSGALNVTGETIIHDDVFVNGDITSNSNIISLGTGAIVLPVGTDGDRLSQQGAVRYNTDQSSFEGYDGSNWGSLGGVSTPDKSTSIVANDTDKTLDFKANNNNVLVVTGSEFTFDSANVTSVSLFGNTINGIDVTTLSQSETSIPSSNAVYEAIASVSNAVGNLDVSTIKTVDDKTKIFANGVNQTLEFYANNNNVLNITEDEFRLFNYNFTGVTSNLFSDTSSTKLATANAVNALVYAISSVPGPPGPPGPSGNTGTIDIGSIYSVPLVNGANVWNTGTDTAAILNFEIPQGERGEAGTITIGYANTVDESNNATVFNTGTIYDAIFNFEIPRGNTGVSLSSVTKVSNNVIRFDFDNGYNTQFDFNFGRLLPILESQKNTIIGEDYELRAIIDDSTNIATGVLTVFDATSQNWVDIRADFIETGTSNTTQFFAISANTITNELEMYTANSTDVVDVTNFDEWFLGTGVDFEIQNNSLIIELQ